MPHPTWFKSNVGPAEYILLVISYLASNIYSLFAGCGPVLRPWRVVLAILALRLTSKHSIVGVILFIYNMRSLMGCVLSDGIGLEHLSGKLKCVTVRSITRLNYIFIPG